MSVMIGATPIKSLSPSAMVGGVRKDSPEPKQETKAEAKKPKPKKEK